MHSETSEEEVTAVTEKTDEMISHSAGASAAGPVQPFIYFLKDKAAGGINALNVIFVSRVLRCQEVKRLTWLRSR